MTNGTIVLPDAPAALRNSLAAGAAVGWRGNPATSASDRPRVESL